MSQFYVVYITFVNKIQNIDKLYWSRQRIDITLSGGVDSVLNHWQIKLDSNIAYQSMPQLRDMRGEWSNDSLFDNPVGSNNELDWPELLGYNN